MAVFGSSVRSAGQMVIKPGGSGNDAVVVEGLMDFLRKASQSSPEFNKQARLASKRVAQIIVDEATKNAALVRDGRQALQVMKGIKAQSDRIPTIKLDEKSGFVSESFPNRKRGKRGGKKVTRADVFFGAEFGGGKFGKSNKTKAQAAKMYERKDSSGRVIERQTKQLARKGAGHTTQFLRHRGKSGYFFWPAVRQKKDQIALEYLSAIDRIYKNLQ